MRIRGYKEASGLGLDDTKALLGSPSQYKDSLHSIVIVGIAPDGRLVHGTARITIEDGDLVICSIRSLNRGAGTMMMRRFTDLADKHGLSITDLNPAPYPLSRHASGVRKLTKKELISFYERFGFEMQDGLMARPPSR